MLVFAGASEVERRTRNQYDIEQRTSPLLKRQFYQMMRVLWGQHQPLVLEAAGLEEVEEEEDCGGGDSGVNLSCRQSWCWILHSIRCTHQRLVEEQDGILWR